MKRFRSVLQAGTFFLSRTGFVFFLHLYLSFHFPVCGFFIFLRLTSMKKLIFFLLLLVSTGAFSQQMMNAVIGDTGWKTILKNNPAASETEKIQAHLFYVESYLRLHAPEGLTSGQLSNRLFLLNALSNYRKNGKFPKNEDYPGERRPHFIDSEGTICAVGYLVEQSAGREEAERINSKYSYARITEMQDAGLKNWMYENGFTLQECAMIQPQYSFGEGPTLEALPIDSLPEILARKIKYNGNADTAYISFVIKGNGAFSSGQVDSGNAVLGKAALNVLEKEKYNGAWSSQMGGSKSHYNSKVSFSVYYGIPVENSGNVNIVYRKTAAENENQVTISGTVTEKLSAETLPGIVVLIYNDSGKVIGGCTTDMDGRYKITLSKSNTKMVRLEFKCMGYSTNIARYIPFSSCEVSAQLEQDNDDVPCNSLHCIRNLYIRAKGA